MNKTIVFILTVLISPAIAAIFGVLHNQLTYTISSEFFTKFMFEQFGFVEYGHNTPRLTASIIGAWSTWWFGLIFGFIFAAIACNQSTTPSMIRNIKKSVIITLVTTLNIGLIGLLYGFSGLSSSYSTCCFPLQINQISSFIAVSEMHTFGYIGAVIGIVIAVLYQLRSKAIA